VRQLAARYLEKSDNCIAILDGDQRREQLDLMKKVRTHVETRYRNSETEINEWIDTRLAFLPSNKWPERWLVETARNATDKAALTYTWGVDSTARLDNALENALLAGKHREFFTLHEEMQQPVGQIVCDLARFVNKSQPEDMEDIASKIEVML